MCLLIIISISPISPLGLVGHSAVYQASTAAIYVLPGRQTTDGSGITSQAMYVLDLTQGIWSKHLYKNLVSLYSRCHTNLSIALPTCALLLC